MGRYRYSFPNCFLPLFLAFWMIFGGGLFWSPGVPVLFVISLVGLSIRAAAAWRSGARPALLNPALALAAAALVSLAGNLDIFLQGGWWMMVLLFGLAGLVVSAELGEDRLLEALYWAGWIWLVFWPLPRLWGGVDNRNLLCVWPVVAILVILMRGKPWWWALPYAVVLVWLGSRGAILGLCLGLLVLYRPRLNQGQVVMSAIVGASFLWALTVVRPQEAMNRFDYWNQAARELVQHNVWLGLGPGGIYARRAILEPGAPPGLPQSYHGHAHNFIIQVLAELGLVGGLALIAAGILVVRTGLRWSWQLPILAALLVHCLVDFPLYFPGPLLVFMVLAGSLSPQRRLVPALLKPLHEIPTRPVWARRTESGD